MNINTILGLVACAFAIACVAFFVGFLSGLSVKDELDKRNK